MTMRENIYTSIYFHCNCILSHRVPIGIRRSGEESLIRDFNLKPNHSLANQTFLSIPYDQELSKFSNICSHSRIRDFYCISLCFILIFGFSVFIEVLYALDVLFLLYL